MNTTDTTHWTTIHSIADIAAEAALIDRWALATGRTGPRHRASRQGKRRKLRAHGLNAAYAQTLRMECLTAK